MVSLWGSKKAGEEDGTEDIAGHGSDGGPSSRPVSTRDANERTRLLNDGRDHPPPGGRRGDGYLDPDDPAVSPYNLWTVRALRYFTVLFAMITFVWWVLLLVSLFVSPPGMNTPGSGFTDFAYTTLTFGILLMSLIFFSVPSKAIRFSVMIIAVLLLVDMIITLSVKSIRHEEAWVGMVSSIWAVLMAAWVVMSDRVVAWGKHEEEERLTGRAESRRTLKQWIAVFLATFIAIIYIVVVILFTATLILRCMDRGLEPDGTLYEVDSGKYSVHLNCIGEIHTNSQTDKPEPTIILESGEVPSEYDFEHWAYAARKNGTIDRYCYWDRPGYAWSDNAPSPFDAGSAATALSEALAQAGEEGPWISVSAGYGSNVARIWASRNQNRVIGIMMIDPLHEDLLNRVGGAYQGFKLWGYGIIAPLGIRRIGGAIFNSRTSEDRVYGNSVWTTGKFIKAKLQENLVAESLTKSNVAQTRSFLNKKMPLAVVSSGIKVRSDEEWERKQKDLSQMTENLVSWDVVNKAPHQVWDTLKGREVMEKRLGELVGAAKKYKPTEVEEADLLAGYAIVDEILEDGIADELRP